MHLTTIYSNNQNAIALTTNLKYHSWNKQTNTQYHFIHDKIQFKHIQLAYVSIDDIPIDVLTKSLLTTKHYHCLNKLGMIIIPPDFQLFPAIESIFLMSLFNTTRTNQTNLPIVPCIQALMAYVGGFFKSYK
jgi:hypothetical protein